MTVLGMQKILSFDRYDPPEVSASDHTINIVKMVENEEGETVKKTVAQDLTLQEVYDSYVEPGRWLQLADTVPKVDTSVDPAVLREKGTVQRYRDYVVLEAHGSGAKAEVPRKKLGKVLKVLANREEIEHLLTLRKVHLLLGSPMYHVTEMMDKTYQWIELGCPVEFSIRARNITTKDYVERGMVSKDIFEYVFKHFPHLRPDFILKSMPVGTKYLVKPFSDGRHVQFVLGGEREFKKDSFKTDLTQRALNVKQAVLQSKKEAEALHRARGQQKGADIGARPKPKRAKNLISKTKQGNVEKNIEKIN